MDTIPVECRQEMHCGWLPRETHVGGTDGVYQPDDFAAFNDDDETSLSICAGYTTTLPEVGDVVRNFYHWENGTIREMCPSGVSRPLLVGLSLYKSSGEGRSAFRLAEQAEQQRRKAGGHV